MEKLKVNETSVRTARNFLINNIEVELEMSEKVAEFKNVEISLSIFSKKWCETRNIPEEKK